MRKSVALQQELGPVFDITFDCEDGATVGNEEAHAKLAASILGSKDNLFNRVGVRVHDCDHPCFEQDISIVCEHALRLAYIVIPKIKSISDINRALDIVNRYARAAGRDNLPVHVLIETHGALAEVRHIAALPQIECLSFGIMDFVSAHGGAIPGSAMRSPHQFSHPLVARAKLEIAAACHLYGKVPSHNVTTEINDAAMVANDAQRAYSEFGYMRMWSIHPNQIKPILKAFSPSTSEVLLAVNILLKALHADWGPIQYNGRLHDRASYRHYWTVLQHARSTGQSLPASAACLL